MMTTAFERIISALEQHGARVTGSGNRRSARCPAHDDGRASLSLTGIDGQALIYCHAGCQTFDVLDSLGLGMADLYDEKRGATYRYRDGRTVHRTPGKRFRQSGDTKGNALYRVDSVRTAVTAGQPVYVVEGEKDVHAAESLGATATCSAMGAGKAHKADWSPLRGARVVIVADRDEPGEKHARDVRRMLAGIAGSVAVVHARVGKDTADHVAAGYGLDDFEPVQLDDDQAGDPYAGVPHPADREPDDDDGGESGQGRKSAATILVEIAAELYRFGVSGDGETFGVPRSGPKVVRLLRGGKTSLRGQLSREYFTRYHKAAPQQALADALLVIEGIAQDSQEKRLYLRVATGQDGAWWLDLGDPTGRAVCITSTGWTVHPQPPVLFKRTALNSELPEPAHGGDLAELWRWLNVTPEDRPLIAAWLVAVLAGDIPHPILFPNGEQGAGKSTAAKVLALVLDPSPVPLRKPPRDADSWVTAAAGSWVVGIDNVSDIQPWLSDSLCRAVTGDGDVRRKLYTDGDLTVFAFRRCLILNGIDLGTVRGDLADRLLPVHLDVIDESRRLTETSLWPLWTDAHPMILGAVLDLAAGVKAALPSVRLGRKPRMADYAELLAAADLVLGTAGLDRYLAKQGELAMESLTGDPFVTAMAASIITFEGTAAELLGKVPPPESGRAPKGWPTNARQVTTRLRRQAPVMRKAGWQVHDDGGANKAKIARWTIIPPARPEMVGNPDPPDPPDLLSQVNRGDKGHPVDPPLTRQAGQVTRQAGQGGSTTEPGGSTAGQESDHQRDVSARQTQSAGQAGQAGHEYGTSQDDDDRPCDRCQASPSRVAEGGTWFCRTCAPSLWKPTPWSPPPGAQCCTRAGAFELGCQLCPHSPTYWKTGTAS